MFNSPYVIIISNWCGFQFILQLSTHYNVAHTRFKDGNMVPAKKMADSMCKLKRAKTRKNIMAP